MIFFRKFYFLAAFIIAAPLCSYADDNAYQMRSYIRTTYPESVKTVHQLVLYIIAGTEFRLYAGRNAPDDALGILNQKVPYQREGVLTTRRDALLMAVGDKNSIVIDYENNLVSVTRSPIDEI